MKIIDCHFHWWPEAYFKRLTSRREYPLMSVNEAGRYFYMRRNGEKPFGYGSPVWFDLDRQMDHLNSFGHDVSVVSSIGPFSPSFTDFSAEDGFENAMHWNTHMAEGQRRYPGRFWGTAAVPLADTDTAIRVLEHAVLELGLVGVNIPGSIAGDPRIDASRLEPFYSRLEQLGVTAFLHPTDDFFPDTMPGYNGALYLGLGRVVDLSVTGMRVVLSGLMERYPKLRFYISHTGGALPYQSGRMDKNSKAANLPNPPSFYLKRMVTDTTTPHALGVRTAIEYYGVDNVMYGSDYPCWTVEEAIAVVDEAGLNDVDRIKVFHDNVIRLFGLKGVTKILT